VPDVVFLPAISHRRYPLSGFRLTVRDLRYYKVRNDTMNVIVTFGTRDIETQETRKCEISRQKLHGTGLYLSFVFVRWKQVYSYLDSHLIRLP
jgi:hypothetical protein